MRGQRRERDQLYYFKLYIQDTRKDVLGYDKKGMHAWKMCLCMLMGFRVCHPQIGDLDLRENSRGRKVPVTFSSPFHLKLDIEKNC